MKTKIILVLFASLIFGASGCGVPLDAPPPPQYILALEIVDQAGNNISQAAAANIKGSILYSDSGIALYEPSFYARLCEDNVYFLITNGHGKFEDADSSELALTWKIQSEVIFGDKTVHSIESKWVKGYHYPDRCESFELEGITYYPAPKNGYLSTARVVINR